MRRQNIFGTAGLCLLLCLALLAAAACRPAGGGPIAGHPETPKEETAMPDQNQTKPPMDLDLPEHLETATFALG